MCGLLVLYLCEQQQLLLFYIFSVKYVDHYSFYLFSRAHYCTVFLAPFTSMGRVSVTTFRLRNLDCKYLIWSPWCLNLVNRFPFIVISLVLDAFRATVAYAKFMKAYSIFLCFILLMIPCPDVPDICLRSSMSRYPPYKCALNRTHVRSLAATLFHMQYICAYSCIT